MKKEKQSKTQKTKELIKQSFNKEKGITLIALIITIIVLIILAGISISLVLGQNGLFGKAKSASVETKKAKVIEDAGLAYSEAYIEKAEKSDSNAVTIGDIVSKLKSGYGYTNEQIVMVSSGVTDITLSETDIKLEPGETKDITVTLGNGTYYVLIEGLYYPITLSNGEVTLGNGVASLPDGVGTTTAIGATTESEIINVTVENNIITITAKDEKTGEATITVTYGKITKTITVTIKDEIKQGDELPLGDVTVTINGNTRKLEQKWKYFYEDKENDKVWLIYSDIMEKTALQTSKTIKLNGNCVYSSSSSQDFLDYLNGVENYEGQWNYIKTGIQNAIGIQIDDNKVEVKGSPDVQLWKNAYNDMYPSEIFEVEGDDTLGWRYRLGGTGDFSLSIDVRDMDKKPLFFGIDNYWLVGPAAQYANCICSVRMNTRIWYNYFNITSNGVRPVVSIPKSVFNQLVN